MAEPLQTRMLHYSREKGLHSPVSAARYRGVGAIPGWDPIEYLSERDGQATAPDVLLALNRYLGLAPATSRNLSNVPESITTVIPSQQAAKEAVAVFNNAGAKPGMDAATKLALINQYINTYGLPGRSP